MALNPITGRWIPAFAGMTVFEFLDRIFDVVVAFYQIFQKGIFYDDGARPTGGGG